MENSPLSIQNGKKRKLDELEKAELQQTCQILQKNKNSNETPVQDKQTPKTITKKNILNNLEKTKIPKSPKKKVNLPNFNTNIINIENNAATTLNQKILFQKISEYDTSTKQYSQKIGENNTKKQKTMSNQNEKNIFKQIISGSQNSQMYTTQFQEDLEREFDDYAKIILQKKAKHNEVQGINSIDWVNNEFGTQTQIAKTESSNKKNKLSSAYFNEIGPYFGLPNKVKKLLKELKGIEKLYGKFPTITILINKFIKKKSSQIGKKNAYNSKAFSNEAT